jgi:hypothetical protein
LIAKKGSIRRSCRSSGVTGVAGNRIQEPGARSGGRTGRRTGGIERCLVRKKEELSNIGNETASILELLNSEF